MFVMKNEKTMAERNDFKYFDLSPTDEVDANSEYLMALKSAVENEKILNIAVTGIYGSGKSSILQTFRKIYGNEKSTVGKKRFINISLATFCNSEAKKTQGDHDKKETILEDSVSVKEDDKEKQEKEIEQNEVERSLLQQLFYSANPRRILFSRFKRINDISLWKISVFLFCISVWVTSLSYLINPKVGVIYFDNISIINEIFLGGAIPSTAELWFGCIAFFMMLITASAFLSFFIREIAAKIKISKFSVDRVEIEIDTDGCASVFNKYIDEIIYCFEQEKYNIVIIEDLERFKNPQIFIKLRELNTLVNSSGRVKRKVKFIYAIKEEFFLDSERTKFFDFILPVIPYINAGSSEAVFRKIKTDFPQFKELRDDFIDNISVFVSDMRMIKNIANEFVVYKSELKGSIYSKSIDDEKLFALIVYKNLYSKDYSDLQEGKGKIPAWFSKKDEVLKRIIESINTKIKSNKERITSLETEHLLSNKELSVLLIYYIRKYIDSYRGQSELNFSLSIDGVQYTENSFVDNFSFENLSASSVINYRNFKFDISKIDTAFPQSLGLIDRARHISIKSNDYKQKIMNENRRLENEILACKSKTAAELINEYSELDSSKDSLANDKFLLFLIRNEYLTEDYQYLISYFHEGALCNTDYEFLLRIKNRAILEYDYKIFNVTAVVDRLNLIDFKSSSALNFDILDYLLHFSQLPPHADYLDAVLEQIAGRAFIVFEFVDGFYANTENRSKFIYHLCKKQQGIWHQLICSNKYDTDTLHSYLRDIITFADEDDILQIDMKGNLAEYISKQSSFVDLFDENNMQICDRVGHIILELGVRFDDINTETSNIKLLDFILANKLYSINSDLITKILKYKKIGPDTDILTRNYTVILESNFDPLISYVGDNIKVYIDRVYLQLPDNTDEPESTILKILSYPVEKLDIERKHKIILKSKVSFSRVNSIDISLWSFVVAQKKLICKWENIFKCFKNEGLTKELSELIEYNDNCINLTKEDGAFVKDGKLLIREGSEEENELFRMSIEIARSKYLHEKTMCVLCNLIPFVFELDDVESSDLFCSVANVFIQNKNFAFSIDRFDDISTNHSALLINYIESNFIKFSEEIDNNDEGSLKFYEDSLLREILTSEMISLTKRMEYLSSIPQEAICTSPESARAVCMFLSKNTPTIAIPFSYLISSIKSTDEKLIKLKIVLNQIQYVSDEQLVEILDNLGSPYDKLASAKWGVVFDNTPENSSLIEDYQGRFPEQISSIKDVEEKKQIIVYKKRK